jgi:hypothetical protein
MWVDKDDVFADDKVWEFKALNPESETHIRSTSFTKSPHTSAHTLPHLLEQDAARYMSSNGHSDLADEYPAGAIADSPIPFSQEHSGSATNSSVQPVPIVNFTTLHQFNPVTPIFNPRPVTASSSASDIATMF